MSDPRDIERLARLKTALGCIPGVVQEGKFQGPMDYVARWFAAVAEAGWGANRLELGSDLGHMMAAAGGPSAEMIEPLEEHFGVGNASEFEVERAQVLGVQLQPAGWSMWFEAAPRGILAGYGLLGNFPMQAVLDAESLIPNGLGARGLREVNELGASLGAERSRVSLRSPIAPDLSAAEVFNAVTSRWDISSFSPEVMFALTGDRPGGHVHIVVDHGGLIALGLSVDHVDHEGLVRLVELCGGDLDGLVRFEEALGVHGRGAVLWRDASGMRLSLRYEVG